MTTQRCCKAGFHFQALFVPSVARLLVPIEGAQLEFDSLNLGLGRVVALVDIPKEVVV